MRKGVAISATAHSAFLLWATLTLPATPYKAEMPKPIVLDIPADAGDTQLTFGAKTAPAPQPRPFAEQVAPSKAPDDPLAKVANKEVKAAVEAQPPMPDPKPAPPAAEKQTEPKKDLI